MMIVLGGRTNTVGETVYMEIYETETSEWKKFNSVQRFRHTVWTVDANIYMHGGFENETPNIPTDSILKLDLVSYIKNIPLYMAKCEAAFKSQLKNDSKSPQMNNSEQALSAGVNKPQTPPMVGLAKAHMKIRMGKGEIEQKKGHAPQVITFNGDTDGKPKATKNVESLHQLFLNHLLRPKEWSASVDG